MKFFNENFEPRCAQHCSGFFGDLLGGLTPGGGGGGGSSKSSADTACGGSGTGGFFGGGGHTSCATTNADSTNNQFQGPANFGSGDLTITQASPEEIAAGRDIALAGVAASEYGASAAVSASKTALDTVSRFGDSAFSTVEKALGRVSGAYESAADYEYRALGSSLDFVRDLQRSSLSQVGETVSALNAISTEQNKSTDQRVAEISQNAIKYVIWGVGLLVVGVVAYSAMRGK